MFATACDSKPEANSSSVTKSGGDAGATASQSFEAPGLDHPLTTLDGQPKSLKDFAGKYVVLNFWATWCVPCVAEMPALERLSQSLKGKGIEVVTVNTDPAGDDEKVKAFMKEKGLTLTVLRDPESKLITLFNLRGFPETFFLGPKGELLEVVDPDSGKSDRRIISDRPWDSPTYVNLVSGLATRSK